MSRRQMPGDFQCDSTKATGDQVGAAFAKAYTTLVRRVERQRIESTNKPVIATIGNNVTDRIFCLARRYFIEQCIHQLLLTAVRFCTE